MMTQYVLYSETHGYFKPSSSGSLHYHETDFVTGLQHALWFKTRGNAVQRMIELYPTFEVNVMPIEITVQELDVCDTVDDVKVEMQKLVDEMNAVSDTELDAWSVKKHNKAASARARLTQYNTN